jgi:hypothetical protein
VVRRKRLARRAPRRARHRAARQRRDRDARLAPGETYAARARDLALFVFVV